MRARSRAWALLLAPALLLAGCGGGDDGGGTQATTPPQPAKVAVTATASGDQVVFDLPAQVKPGAGR
jgi:multidrug efflux pump subunit AcrA (membrane-fusion protein)